MARFVLLVLALDALLLGAVLAVWTAGRASDGDPVYSVAALDAQLEQAGIAWVGRTVRVRGAVGNCGPLNGPPMFCQVPQPQAGAGSLSVDPLPLALAHPTALQRSFQPLPVLRNLVVEPPSALSADEAGVFRITLQRQRDLDCGSAVCYEGLVVAVTVTNSPEAGSAH